MKTKIEYERLEYDVWNLSELKEIFDRGELYYCDCGQYFKIKDLPELFRSIGLKGGIYKRVEAKVTLEDELLGVEQIDRGSSLEFAFEDGKVSIYGIFYKAGLTPENIHRLSEILKRHGK